MKARIKDCDYKRSGLDSLGCEALKFRAPVKIISDLVGDGLEASDMDSFITQSVHWTVRPFISAFLAELVGGPASRLLAQHMSEKI